MGKDNLSSLVRHLKEAGLVALEAVYSTYSAGEERQMRQLAARYGLLISGGSDFHGKSKPGLELGTGYGKLFIPEDILIALKKKGRNCSMSEKILFTDLDGTLLNSAKKFRPVCSCCFPKWC
ncbi:MAG: hypothetical protein ACLURV_12610 [Gallintestinimicrobium sp.]